MSKNDKGDTNINAPIQAANLNLGHQETHGNFTITIRDMTQTIHGGNAPSDDKEALLKLVDDLKESLTDIPAEHKEGAEQVVKRTEQLVEEVSEDEVDPDIVEKKASRLKKAAEDIKEALPVVLGIATSIVAHALKMAG